MPSPFPGMDPYLEEPGLWPDVHHSLISQMQAVLNVQVTPKYHVRVEERVYVSDENDPGREVIVPDLRIAKVHEESRSRMPTPLAPLVAEPIEATTLIEDEIHEARLEVIDRLSRTVVTVIEVLSPSNKFAGSRGQASYREKRHEVMNSPSHLMEIDLLRSGVSSVARRLVPHADYVVHVSRADRRPKGWLWPIRLQQRLPVVAVPLRDDDPDAALDLQEVLNVAYDRARYDVEVNYRSDPVPPLTGPAAEWAKSLLKEKGFG